MSTFTVTNAPLQVTSTLEQLVTNIYNARSGTVITVTQAGDPIAITLTSLVKEGYGVIVVMPEDQVYRVTLEGNTRGIHFIGGTVSADLVVGSTQGVNHGFIVTEGSGPTSLRGAKVTRNQNAVSGNGAIDLLIANNIFDGARADSVGVVTANRVAFINNNVYPGVKGEKICYFGDGREPQYGISQSACTSAGGIWEDTPHNDVVQAREQCENVIIENNYVSGSMQGFVSFGDDIDGDTIRKARVSNNVIETDSPWSIWMFGNDLEASNNTSTTGAIRLLGRPDEESIRIRGGRNVGPSLFADRGVSLDSETINGDQVIEPEYPRIVIPAWAPAVATPDAPAQDYPPEYIASAGIRWTSMPNEPTIGTWLTLNRGQWIGFSGAVWEYQWTRDGVDIDQAVDPVYQVQVQDSNTNIGCRVRATNSSGTGSWYDIDQVLIPEIDLENVVIGFFGQSQVSHVIEDGTLTATITPPSGIPDDNMVIYLQTGASDEITGEQDPPRRVDVSQATAEAELVNPAMAAGAVWLKRVLPTHRFVCVDLAVPGTGRGGLWSDSNPDRAWSDFDGILTQVESDFGELDLLLECWQGNDHSAARASRSEMFPFYTGQRVGGEPFTIGSVNPDAVQLTDPVDHILWDIEANAADKGRGRFRRSKTKWACLGWPTLGAGSTTTEWQSFTTDSSGNTLSGYPTTLGHPARAEIDAFHADNRLSDFALGQHFSSHIADMNGTTHPIKTDPDGLVLHGWPYIQMMARFAGLSIDTPTILATEGPLDGSYLDVLVSLPNGGTLTTLGALESRTPPATLPPHWQPVIGFELLRSGVKRPVFRTDSGESYPDSHKGTVEIHSAFEVHETYGRVGRIRITPLTPFNFGDTVEFLNGDASAVLLEPRDVEAKLWTRFPLEHVSDWYFEEDTYPMPGVAVRPQAVGLPVTTESPEFTAQSVTFDGASSRLRNTSLALTGTARGLVSAWIYMPTTWQTGKSIFEARVGSTAVLAATTTSSNRITLRLNHDGTASDAWAGTQSLYGVDQWYHILWAWDYDEGRFQLYINDTPISTNYSWENSTKLDLDGATITQFAVGSTSASSGYWPGSLAHIWLSVSQTLDLSVQENREKFALNGAPVNVGSIGQLVTGTAPEFYMNGEGSAWNNLGTAGALTLDGTLVSGAAPSY